MMSPHVVKILSIVGLIIALAIVSSMLLFRSQSQAMPPDADEQSQLREEQVSPQDKATATIPIMWTTMPIAGDIETQLAAD